MKKVALAAAFVGLLALTSCNKCEDCHYDLSGAEVEIGELCGDELKDAEENGYTINDSTVVTIHCEEH